MHPCTYLNLRQSPSLYLNLIYTQLESVSVTVHTINTHGTEEMCCEPEQYLADSTFVTAVPLHIRRFLIKVWIHVSATEKYFLMTDHCSAPQTSSLFFFSQKQLLFCTDAPVISSLQLLFRGFNGIGGAGVCTLQRFAWHECILCTSALAFFDAELVSVLHCILSWEKKSMRYFVKCEKKLFISLLSSMSCSILSSFSFFNHFLWTKIHD